mgnify:CR=1 FL=1
MTEDEFSRLTEIPDTSEKEFSSAFSGLDESYVIEHNDELTEKYLAIIKAAGYEDFHNYYLSGKADFTEDNGVVDTKGDFASKSTSKRKDTSKLQLVQRTVMRRGKPTTLSFYQDPDKASESTNSSGKDGSGSASANVGQEPGVYTGGPKFGSPTIESIALANPPDSFYTRGKYSSRLYDYLFDASDHITGVLGVTRDKDMLSPRYIASQDKDGFQAECNTLVKHLVKLAWQNEYGLSVPVGLSDQLLGYLGFKKAKGLYTCKDLSKILGDVPWK